MLSGNWVWACDVDIGEDDLLTNVPVTSNNREIYYAEEGKGVNLSRLGSGKWAITGLSKTLNSTVHYTYLTFADDMWEHHPHGVTGEHVSASHLWRAWARWSPLMVMGCCLMGREANSMLTASLSRSWSVNHERRPYLKPLLTGMTDYIAQHNANYTLIETNLNYLLGMIAGQAWRRNFGPGRPQGDF